MDVNKTTLHVYDIFESISGEAGGFPQGTWSTFIRLRGCNLACSYCDTLLARDPDPFNPFSEETIFSIQQKVREFGNNHILITGGEPLQQPNIIELIGELVKDDYIIQVETNGSFPIPVIPGVHWVIDYKGPSSGMNHLMLSLDSFVFQLGELSWIQRHSRLDIPGSCCVKFVVANGEDLDCALKVIRRLKYAGVFIPFLISPVDAKGEMIPELVKEIKQKNPNLLRNIIFSVQLHKILNLP